MTVLDRVHKRGRPEDFLAPMSYFRSIYECHEALGRREDLPVKVWRLDVDSLPPDEAAAKLDRHIREVVQSRENQQNEG